MQHEWFLLHTSSATHELLMSKRYKEKLGR
jgi:hypothetical protein